MHLRSKEHGGSTNKLKFSTQNSHVRQKPVDVIDSKMRGLRVQLVFVSDFYKPVDENRSHAGGYVLLFAHVVGLRSMKLLLKIIVFDNKLTQVEQKFRRVAIIAMKPSVHREVHFFATLTNEPPYLCFAQMLKYFGCVLGKSVNTSIGVNVENV